MAKGIPKMWLVIGPVEHWDTAFDEPIPVWGLKEVYINTFQFLSRGDQIAIYATSPIKGIVGLASVKDKYVDQDTLIWKEEKEKGRVIWPLRFRLSDMRILPKQFWTRKEGTVSPGPVDIRDFQMFWQRGFQELTETQAAIVFERTREKWGKDLLLAPIKESSDEYGSEEKGKMVESKVPSHRKIQEDIADIGRLQFYYPELEFVLPLESENKRMDVVWKRELSGVPTFAFEIELSGGIEKAITKLRLAYTKWNSQPRLVIPEPEHRSVENLVSREQKYFQNNFRYYDPSVIQHLLLKKQDLRSFEERYGIY